MAVTADKVVVELELKDGQYLAKVRQAETQFNKSQRSMANESEKAEKQIRAASAGISSSIKRMAGSLAAGASAAAIIKMADGYTNLQNRLRATGLEGQALADIQDKLYDAANKNGIAVDAVAQLYQRATLAQKNLGASSEQIISLTNGVAAALRVQGVSAEQASGPLLQLGQALGAGTVRAEELNSLLEGTPLLLQAAANGSQRFSGDMNALSAAIRDGKVSSQELFQALLKGLPEVEAQAAKMPKTVGQAFQILNNQLGRYVGQTDQSLSATQRLAQGIEMLANNLDKVVPALGVIAAIIGGKLVASMAAASTATVKQRIDTALAAQNALAHAAAVEAQNRANARLVASGGAASAALKHQAASSLSAAGAARAMGGSLLALAGGPIGVVGLAIGGLTYALVQLTAKEIDYGNATKEVTSATDALGKATDAYRVAAETAATATGKGAKAARDAAAAAKAQAIAERDAAAALLVKAKATIAAINAQVMQDVQSERFNIRGDRPGSVRTTGDDAAYRTAMASQEALNKRIAEANALIDEANKSLEERPKITADDKDTGKKEKDRTQERARLIADLEIQSKIEEAQLRNDMARVRELEREVEITARLRQLKDAGFSAEKAAEISAGIQTRLDEARLSNMLDLADAQRKNVELTISELYENYEVVRQKKLQLEYEELLKAYKETSADSAEAEKRAMEDIASIEEARNQAAKRFIATQGKSHELRIAELLGNEKLVKSLQDQEEIVRRTNELREKGRLSQKDAERQATIQVQAERGAAEYASQRDMFASTFSEGIRAAMAGDLQGFLSSQFGNLADMAFKNLGKALFDSFSEIPADVAKAQAEGTAQGVAAGATIATSMTAAGTSVAAMIGTAILTSGTQVAAMMAAFKATDSGFLPFGGFKANGGPVKSGTAYTVGENGRETFVPTQNGYIIPNMKNARMSSSMGGVVKLIVDEGSAFQARVEQISGPIAVQAAAGSAAYSQDSMRTARRRQSQSFV